MQLQIIIIMKKSQKHQKFVIKVIHMKAMGEKYMKEEITSKVLPISFLLDKLIDM